MKYHKKLSYLLVAWIALLVPSAVALVLNIDVNSDSVVDATDIQLCINKVLDLDITGNADVNGDDSVDAIDVQVIINAVLGILPDSDGDGLDDVFEVNYDGEPGYNPYPAGGDLDGENPDTDRDGVSDGIEIDVGTNPLDSLDAPADSDGDGLYDPIEDDYGTNPNLADSDGDGLSDGDEVYAHGTNPTVTDTDSDGLNDGDEVNIHSTAPTDEDTDDDGLNDGDEVNVYGTGPGAPDTDFDGLTDGDEVNTFGTLPTAADTDFDRLTDGGEVNTYGTNPLDDDSDNDGLIDGDEVYTYFTEPTVPDTDGDGLTDGDEVTVHGTNPLDSDSDFDQLPDGWEILYGLSPISTIGDDGTSGNPDDDAFSNIEEYQNGTDPTVFDGGQPPEDFSGTWVGSYETISSDAYPSSAMPHGYLIATIAQTGSDVTVTFPIGSGGMTGTVTGDTLTADGTLWTDIPLSTTLTISGTQLTGTFESGTAGNIDQGTFDLTLTSGPPAQIQTGDWYGTIEDKYDSEGYQMYGVLFTNIEVHSSSHIVVNVEYDEAENPGEVFSLAGEIAGNVFMCMASGGGWFVYLTGVIESDDHVSGTWQEVGDGDFGWGEFEQWLSPGPQIDMNGTWRVSFQNVYPDTESGALDLSFTQNGTSLSAVEMPVSGEVRGNMFVLVGNDENGDPMRIDGEMDLGTGRISGTFQGEDDWEWWWGTYTGQRR